MQKSGIYGSGLSSREYAHKYKCIFHAQNIDALYSGDKKINAI